MGQFREIYYVLFLWKRRHVCLRLRHLQRSTDWFIKYKRKYYWLVIFIKQPARKKTVKKSQVMEILRIHLNLIKVKGDNLM